MNSRVRWGLGVSLACIGLAVGNRVFAQAPAASSALAPVTQPAASPDAASVQTLFEKSAAELEFFDLKPFLYNRQELDFRLGEQGADKKYFAALARVTHRNLPLAPVEALLKHTNAGVRTLALAALFNRDDPQLLPVIVKLSEDTASTFPGYGKLSQNWLRTTGIGPPKREQTVGDIAKAMVTFYQSRAKFAPPPHQGLSQIPTFESKFEDYWRVLKGRSYCASWFGVKLARASRGISPTQPEYAPDIRRVRAELDAIPRNDRNWILLYLNGEAGSDILATEAELIAVMREIGPVQLMRWLKGQPVSQIPDLHMDDWKKKVVLQNARLLLQPSQADELIKQGNLKMGKEEDPAVWFTAAASLDVKNGRNILKSAWPKFQGQYDGNNQVILAVALAKKGNRADWPFLSDWFFAPKPKNYDGTMEPGRQASFVSNLITPPALTLTEPRIHTKKPVSPFLRQLLAHLVNDPRFNKSEFWAVYEILDAINASQPKPLADGQKFYEAADIGGEQRPAAQAALKAMKNKLRATSPQWSR
ncbi:hypothetical protein IAD21_01129 [Abditibacteriota bacterium]|nr:hypothetical protein IAD21_01129 [Abditibacteriota bacterium]